MDQNTQALIIAVTSLSSVIMMCCCYNYYKGIKAEQSKNKLENTRKKLMVKNKIKPIIQMTNEELKDEFEQYEIRRPQITGEENV